MRTRRLAVLVGLCLAITGCATGGGTTRPDAGGPRAALPPARIPPPPTVPPEPERPRVQTGIASWYGRPHHGRRTASGEVFDMHAMTAAHRSLPLGTRVRVTNVENGRSVVVRINDRGPFVDGRVIDVSRAAALALGAIGNGVFPVRLEVLEEAAADSPDEDERAR